MRKNQPKQLMDWVANSLCSGPALALRVAEFSTLQPVFDERLDVTRKFVESARTGYPGKVSKAHQDWYTYKHIPRGVVLLAEPGNVTLDGVADPRCADSVHGSRADEVTVQHDNLLSEYSRRRSSR
jgi:hypothetical protein